MGGPYFATTLTTTAKRQFSMQCDDLTTQFAKQKDIRWVDILVSSNLPHITFLTGLLKNRANTCRVL